MTVYVCVCVCLSARISLELHVRCLPKIFVIVTVARSSSYCGRRGVVVSGVRRMNEVNARRAWLVPGWVTVCGRVYHLGM